MCMLYVCNCKCKFQMLLGHYLLYFVYFPTLQENNCLILILSGWWGGGEGDVNNLKMNEIVKYVQVYMSEYSSHGI